MSYPATGFQANLNFEFELPALHESNNFHWIPSEFELPQRLTKMVKVSKDPASALKRGMHTNIKENHGEWYLHADRNLYQKIYM